LVDGLKLISSMVMGFSLGGVENADACPPIPRINMNSVTANSNVRIFILLSFVRILRDDYFASSSHLL
jgi:hypothetical protein